MRVQFETLNNTARFAALLGMILTSDKLYAAHPLITEDAGTQGKGNVQLELNGEWGARKEAGTRVNSSEILAALSYGVADAVDLIVGAPYVREESRSSIGNESVSGVADSSVDVKWRFREYGSTSLALKVGITLPTGDETLGLGNGKAGYSTYIIASWDYAQWATATHIGRIANRNSLGDREELWHASISGARQLGDMLKLLADVGILTNPDSSESKPLDYVNVGFIYSFTQNIDLDIGAKKGIEYAGVDYALLAGLAVRF